MLPCPSVCRLFCRAALLACLAGACGGAETSAPEVPANGPAPEEGPRIEFEYTALDGSPVSTSTLAGRLSVLGFITTYDPASQLQARHLQRVLHAHAPRINAALFVLEAPENRPMAEAFAHVLKLTCPVVMADKALLLGNGPFEGIHSVPSLIILNRRGREVFRYYGVLDENGLDKTLRALEQATSNKAR